jgi:hypothetical protein
VGLKEAITAACSSCIRLFGIDRASQGTVLYSAGQGHDGNGSAERGASDHGMLLTEGDVAALRAAAVNKEATLSAIPCRWALAGTSSRATQAMFITREMPRFLLGVYLVVYLCFGVW